MKLRFAAAALCGALLLVISGCTVFDTWHKCGFAGCPGDQEITDSVTKIFEQHPDLGPVGLLSIKTLDGVVYISGKLDTDLQRRAAEELALTAPNVKRVVNNTFINNTAH
jgi:osmotically-inducible protein OsmY